MTEFNVSCQMLLGRTFSARGLLGKRKSAQIANQSMAASEHSSKKYQHDSQLPKTETFHGDLLAQHSVKTL